MIKPKALRKNATIGLISPASPTRDTEKLQKGIRYLETLGYRVELGEHVGRQENYLAGTDDERLSDIHSMFLNPRIDAIFCTRGGYGVMRLLERLDYRMIRRHPKIFVGFSDMTALNCALWTQCTLVSFSGAMVGVDMHDFDPESEQQFWSVLQSRRSPVPLRQSTDRQCFIKGRATGRLICGNLSLLAALSGSRFMPSLKDNILLTEDIGEESYRIDRLLCQLDLTGALKQASGLAFGQFTLDVNRVSATASRPVDDVLREYAARYQKPTLGGLMYGHTAKKFTLPFGVICRMDASRKQLVLAESGVS